MKYFFWLALVIVFSSGLWMIGDVIYSGFSGLSFDFIFQSPEFAGRRGGISSIIISTAWIMLICLLISIPVAIGTALFLNEFTEEFPKLAKTVGTALDILAAIPSIVFGLFGNALFCSFLGLGYSLASGGLTLSLMVLPIMIRVMDISFRRISENHKLSAQSLGLRTKTIQLRILIPLALPAIIVGSVLGLARAMAETAALLFTAGYGDRMPETILDSGRTLSVHIYELAMNVPGGNFNAYSTALTLILMMAAINTMVFAFTQKAFSWRSF